MITSQHVIMVHPTQYGWSAFFGEKDHPSLIASADRLDALVECLASLDIESVQLSLRKITI